ncbi:NAD(P)-dependent oxidoreductase [Nocardia sp. alder85J]|uniref:NAD(P)-dependent oxidoreductase n=1 Tax=Nocardia sp. alder85J TaxID=2862949 RepID=UPI001CD334D2|nr:NAD(P)-dependent oxidoreductase [Nocardia sp. alder85J]MCX4094786.1 NAD(P)-dependent oxidoreductase [Nocardia sp. alder85J]
MNGPVAFIGLGNMGRPMSRRLVEAGVDVIGFDPAESARAALVSAGGRVADTAAAAVAGAGFVILMLPTSAIVEAVLGDAAVLAELRPGTVVIDMSSSEPESTQRLSAALAEREITLVDAPVSGGVPGANAGTLALIAGGPDAAVASVAGLLAPLGRLQHVGASGAGHAVKAINNLMSAIHLLGSSEGVAIGQRFGVDPKVLIDTINISSGRSASTELKFPRFILPGTYDSGFAMSLMVKDIRIAQGLAAAVGAHVPLSERAVELWAAASGDLGPGADQTDIARWIGDRTTDPA